MAEASGGTPGTTIGTRLAAARRARDGTQDEVAENARYVGLRWTRAIVANIEAGRRELSAGELLLLPVIYSRSLPELLCPDDAGVEIEDGIRLSCGSFRILLTHASQPVDGWTMIERKPSGEVVIGDQPMIPTTDAAVVETERRAAMSLGLTVPEVRALAIKVFGRSLVEERDARLKKAISDDPRPAGDRLAAARGHTMRRVLSDLERAKRSRRARKAAR